MCFPGNRSGCPLLQAEIWHDAINEGVRRGYDKGYLRKSVVKDPVRRGNTGDNTPAMIYTEIVPGDQVIKLP
jgi:tartrate dehydratase alpha subunit/fumarate hydratase class I-like protein